MMTSLGGDNPLEWSPFLPQDFSSQSSLQATELSSKPSISNSSLLGNNFFASMEKNSLFKYLGRFCKEKCDIKADNLALKSKFVSMGTRLPCAFS